VTIADPITTHVGRRSLPCATVRTTVDLPITIDGVGAVTGHLSSFHGLVDGREHVALRLGPVVEVPLVRMHSECLTGDVFGSQRCDCGPQLAESLAMIASHGGLVLYLRQEGRGIGLYPKIDAYALQAAGMDTFDANKALGFDHDERDFGVAAQMLRALREKTIDLLSNNPDKTAQLRANGINVRAEYPTRTHLCGDNEAYLRAKVQRTSHRLTLVGCNDV
jgi:GTP cyclohydrolase II